MDFSGFWVLISAFVLSISYSKILEVLRTEGYFSRQLGTNVEDVSFLRWETSFLW